MLVSTPDTAMAAVEHDCDLVGDLQTNVVRLPFLSNPIYQLLGQRRPLYELSPCSACVCLPYLLPTVLFAWLEYCLPDQSVTKVS